MIGAGCGEVDGAIKLWFNNSIGSKLQIYIGLNVQFLVLYKQAANAQSVAIAS
jgi:hypothetical protein